MITTALEIVTKATVVLSAVAVAQLIVRRRTSAAMRHLVWTMAIVSVLLLPLLSLTLPRWTVIQVQAAHVTAAVQTTNYIADDSSARPLQASTASSDGAPAADVTAASWAALLAGVYGAGVFIMLVYWTRQRWCVRRLASQAADLGDPEWTRLLRDAADRLRVRPEVCLRRGFERGMPMAFGIRYPTILIPAIADTWSFDRRRAVILHELAHVARRDCLTQSMAFVACVLYWFHPAIWWAARQLRIERELACDDQVIVSGASPRDYAGHLLEIAYSLGAQPLPALAVTMARPRQLEGRMLAALDPTRNRRLPSLRLRALAAAIATSVLIALAGATSTVIAETSSIAGVPLQSPGTGNFAQQQGVLSDGTQPGTWEIRATGTDDTIHLRLMELNSSSGSNMPLQRLEGLTSAQLAGSGGPVQFRLRRDAGTFTFEGVVRGRVGAGTFSFAADPNFAAELAKRGYARPTAREQYQMARHDVGFAFVDELNKQGYTRPQTSDLVRAGQHGVDTAFVRDMAGLGHKLGSLDPLITLRDHGVTPEYVRQLADQGYKGPAADALRRARDHGITPDYIRAMQELGYRSLPMDQLITARDHGIDERYAREMRQLGFKLGIDELLRARDHGVDVEYVRGMGALGYTDQPIDALVRMRDHGVTPEYVQNLKALGYDRLSVDDLVRLRDRGLTSDRVRAANGRTGTRLPVDQLIDFADKGFR
jgi:beta-lactamase regulating signal transducer with metallopeptidase domain